MEKQQRFLSFAALVLGAAVGCQGTIGDASSPGSNPIDPVTGKPTPTDPVTGKPTPGPGSSTPGDPNAAGPMPLRRLTNREYNNTVRDLLGDTSNPANAFPLDYNLTDFQFHRAGGISQQDIDTMKAAAGALAKTAEAKATTLAPCPAGMAEDGCAQTFIKNFGLRAYRRPLTADETSRLTALYTAGRTTLTLSYAGAIGLLVEGIVQSPNFLYHWELGNANAPTMEGQVVKLNPYENASRLSYFLWSSLPDQALFDAAAANKLGTQAEIETQAARMLTDTKASDTVATFIDEWMNLDWILDPDRMKDPVVYPEFTPDLRAAMAAENRDFIDGIMAGDAKMSSLLTATNSYLNQSLGAVYGNTSVKGTALTPANLDPAQRGGLLTRAAFLTVTGATNGSHPVKRGRRIFERMLCNTMPPPPMNVPPPQAPSATNGTTRQRFEAHDKQSCAIGCHAIVDKFGFAFEHYDGIGQYRTMDNGGVVDSASAATIDGKTFTFKDAMDLSQQLATSPLVQSCFAKQWLRYAFKRTETDADLGSIQSAGAAFGKANSIKDLLVGLAGSRSFRYRSPATGEVLK